MIRTGGPAPYGKPPPDGARAVRGAIDISSGPRALGKRPASTYAGGVFRRRSDEASSSTATALAEQDEKTPRDPQAKKGRPTPKRSEAEAHRRTRVTVPKDRKEASRQSRERMRSEREKQRTALLEGDERYLPARDKGPVRRFVRDYVDSRWSLAEFFLPYAVVVLVLSIVRVPALQVLSTLLFVVFFVLVVLDFLRLGLGLRKSLRVRFPDQNTRGAVPYGLMRTLQMRRLRLPKPQVKRGERS
ncbi:membrane protein [Kitasatospora sp. NE20-6]